MKHHEFTLHFRLPSEQAGLVDRLAEAGCKDAIVGTGLPGQVSLQFNRTKLEPAASPQTANRKPQTANRKPSFVATNRNPLFLPQPIFLFQLNCPNLNTSPEDTK